MVFNEFIALRAETSLAFYLKDLFIQPIEDQRVTSRWHCVQYIHLRELISDLTVVYMTI